MEPWRQSKVLGAIWLSKERIGNFSLAFGIHLDTLGGTRPLAHSPGGQDAGKRWKGGKEEQGEGCASDACDSAVGLLRRQAGRGGVLEPVLPVRGNARRASGLREEGESHPDHL